MENPLNAPQREKAGSYTFDKYDFQYHWALYRVIDDIAEARNFAIIIEYHEDVIISDSLDAQNARFEFNQIKTTDAVLKASDLINRKKLKNGSSNSILGKLILSSQNDKFDSTRISNINLITVKGFDLKLSDENLGLKLDKIAIGDLSSGEIEKLEKKISEELSISKLPSNIQFIITDLSEKKYSNDVFAEIAKLIERLHPSYPSKPGLIYRLLIDRLHQVGKDTYDYKTWEDLLNNKSLTSETIRNTIDNITLVKTEEEINDIFLQIIIELGYDNSLKQTQPRNIFRRYRQNMIGNSSLDR
ncbi:DUF4297 domain-containing protein, partial [Dysgonomonas sp. Shenzhen-Wh21]